MPTAPLVLCAERGCSVRVPRGRCSEHAKQFEGRRGTRHERGYDQAWVKLRNWFIKQSVLCAHCRLKGLRVLAAEVDHIVPFAGLNDPLRLDTNNLTGLCVPCHRRKHRKSNDINGMAYVNPWQWGQKYPFRPSRSISKKPCQKMARQ